MDRGESLRELDFPSGSTLEYQDGSPWEHAKLAAALRLVLHTLTEALLRPHCSHSIAFREPRNGGDGGKLPASITPLELSARVGRGKRVCMLGKRSALLWAYLSQVLLQYRVGVSEAHARVHDGPVAPRLSQGRQRRRG